MLDASLTATLLLITGTHMSVKRVRFKGRLFRVQIKMTIWLGSLPPRPRKFHFASSILQITIGGTFGRYVAKKLGVFKCPAVTY